MEGTLQQKSTNMLGGWKTARWFELERNQILPRYDPPHVLAEEAKLVAAAAADEKAKKELEARQAQRAAVLRRASSKPTLAPQLDLDGASVEKDGRDTFILRKKGWATSEMAYRIDADSVKDAGAREKERDVWLAALAVFKASPNRPLKEPTSPKLDGAAAPAAPASPRGSMDGKAPAMFFAFPDATVRALKTCFKFLHEQKNVQLGLADPTVTVALTRSALMDPAFQFAKNESPATVAAVCKVLLKRLPESPFSNALLEPFVAAAVDNKLDELRALLQQLPLQHRDICKSVLNTARKFMKDEKNALTPASVANALGPALTPAIEDEKEYAAKWKDKFIGLFTVMMSHTEPLFSPPSSPALPTRELSTPGSPSAGPALDEGKLVLPSEGAAAQEGAKPADAAAPAKSADAASASAEANSTAPAADAAGNTTAAADANHSASATAPDSTAAPAAAKESGDKPAAAQPASPAKSPAADGAAKPPAAAGAAAAGDADANGQAEGAAAKGGDLKEKQCRACDAGSCIIA